MSGVDLTEAVEALAIRLRLADRNSNGAMPWAALPEDDRVLWRRLARWQVETIAPHIERQVRESLARRIHSDAFDIKRGLPFDDDHDVATVVAWIDEWFEGQS